MDSFTSEQTSKTPLIRFNSITGIFQLQGKSVHENSLQFYEQLFEWLEEYSKQPADKTILNIQMDYFNTSSSKCIMDLFKKLEQISVIGKREVIINWQYDEMDDEMREAGEEYKSIIKIPFNLISFTR